MSCKTMVWQVLLISFFLRSLHGQVSYSIPEEMSKGSFVGSITQDLGLELNRLMSGKARIYTGDSTEYIGLDKEKGALFIREKMDREVLCGKTTPCALHLQVILENPMELYRITIEITDINDNAPSFKKNEMKFEISESAITGAVFMLEKAVDRDVGINGLLSYSLKPTDNFALKLNSQADGSKNVEMILQKPLDREKHERLSLLLTAKDGGEPQMSGTVQIHVTVLDGNDNAPVFTQKIYKTSLTENALRGSKLVTVTATDADSGSNSVVTYYMSNMMEGITDLFSIDPQSGDITVDGVVDYEISSRYELDVQAKDQGGLSDSCKVIIDIIDVNDNKPSISIISKSSSISEESKAGTVIAMMNVNDPDSGKNGQVKCNIEDSIPFTMASPSNNFFSLLTYSELDREKTSEYNISIICSDEGVTPLSNNVTLRLHISDVNDNAPLFEKDHFEAFIVENNSPGLAVFTVKAKDADWNQNARVSYILEESSISGVPVSSYVSVHADSGVIHAIRSFDYEQMKNIKFTIKAQDGGSPPLSSNATVQIIIQDQNDNAPQVLYPVQTSSSVVSELVPRSADVGYLVTKVVAVDVDSGQNAWLSYKLQKAADRALFEVGAQNGEIRTVRQVTDKDGAKQKLIVVIEDNGQPSRSATVIVNVVVADSFPEMLSEFTDVTHDKNYSEDLTFYLVLALAVVSFLFIACLVAIISVKIYRWRHSSILSQSNLPVIPYYPPHYGDGTGTLKHMYNYEVCMTTDSRKSDATFLRPTSQNVLIMDPNTTETMKRIQKEQLFLDDLNSPDQHVYNYEVCGTTDSRMSDVKRIRPYSQNTLVSLSRAGTVQREKTQQEDGDFSSEQKPPNDWRLQPNQRPGPSGQHRFHTIQQRWTPYEKSRAGPLPEGAGVVAGTGPWPNPPTEAEQLHVLMAGANVSEATATMGPRYNAQYVPDYRQNVYIPGSTATLTANPQQPPQQALPPPQVMPPTEAPKAAQTPASKKKSTKKDKK